HLDAHFGRLRRASERIVCQKPPDIKSLQQTNGFPGNVAETNRPHYPATRFLAYPPRACGPIAAPDQAVFPNQVVRRARTRVTMLEATGRITAFLVMYTAISCPVHAGRSM